MRVEVANLAIGQVVMGEFELEYRLEGAVNGGLEMIDKRRLPEARRGDRMHGGQTASPKWVGPGSGQVASEKGTCYR